MDQYIPRMGKQNETTIYVWLSVEGLVLWAAAFGVQDLIRV